MALNHFDQDEMDAWLAEVDMVSDRIKQLSTNQITIEEFDRHSKLKQDKQQRHQAENKQKQQEQRERVIRGRSGQGEQQNYSDFCKRCFTEYTLKTITCLKCKIPTMTCAQRRGELLGKVKDYQEDKNRRAERKRKWELWKKTEAMLYRKTSTQYSKWDYFEDSDSGEDDDQNKAPITPSDDPNFKALQMDMKQRAARNQDNISKAEALKDKGNEQMQLGKFQEAVQFYTEALELKKDIQSIWTNRALAYIKLKRYSKAIHDCTQVIDYAECFEEGYTASRDFCFKAFLRRSWARKDLHEFENAIKDIDEALKLIPTDVDAINLQQQIIEMREQKLKLRSLNEQLQKQKDQKIAAENKQNQLPENTNESQIKKQKVTKKTNGQNSEEGEAEIKNARSPDEEEKEGKVEVDAETEGEDAKKSLQQQKQPTVEATPVEKKESEKSAEQALIDLNIEIESSVEEFKKLNEDFTQLDFIPKLNVTHYTQFFNNELTDLLKKNEENLLYFYKINGLKYLISLIEKGHNVFLPLKIIINDNIFNQREFIRLKGLGMIYLYIKSKIADFAKNQSSFDDLEMSLEILIEMTIIEQIRNTLKEDVVLVEALVSNFDTITKYFDQQPSAVSNFLVLFSNLCYGPTPLKQKLKPQFQVIMNCVYQILVMKSGKAQFDYLRENCFNLLANLLTEAEYREEFMKYNGTEIIETLFEWIMFYDFAHQNNVDNRISDEILSVLVNLTFKQEKTNIANLSDQKWQSLLIFKLARCDQSNKNQENSINRCLQVLAKLNYADNEDLIKKGFLQELLVNYFDDVSVKAGFYSHAIRIISNLFTTPKCLKVIKEIADEKLQQDLHERLRRFINSDDELQFCNTCHLSGLFVETFPELLPQYRDIIPRLITVCRDQTGNLRKNAAIFVSKLTKDPENQQVFMKLHGMDVLKSIHHLVLEK